LRGGFAFAGGELFKLRLCIGRKMNFHAQSVRIAWGPCQARSGVCVSGVCGPLVPLDVKHVHCDR
jgi:hypothetical protein